MCVKIRHMGLDYMNFRHVVLACMKFRQTYMLCLNLRQFSVTVAGDITAQDFINASIEHPHHYAYYLFRLLLHSPTYPVKKGPNKSVGIEVCNKLLVRLWNGAAFCDIIAERSKKSVRVLKKICLDCLKTDRVKDIMYDHRMTYQIVHRLQAALLPMTMYGVLIKDYIRFGIENVINQVIYVAVIVIKGVAIYTAGLNKVLYRYLG